jgi:hypothetical protein
LCRLRSHRARFMVTLVWIHSPSKRVTAFQAMSSGPVNLNAIGGD